MVVKMTANHERLISCMNINDLLTPPKNICLLIHIEWITLTTKIFVSTHVLTHPVTLKSGMKLFVSN
jgi:hypothetical protein